MNGSVDAPILRVRRWLKPVSDALLIAAAFALAYLARYHWQWLRQLEPTYFVPLRVYIPSIAALTAILMLMLWVSGAYGDARGRGLWDEGVIVLRSVVLGIATMIVAVFLSTPSFYSRLIFGYTGIFALVLLGVARIVERNVMNRLHRRGIGVQRLLIAGVGEIGQSVMRSCIARPELGRVVVGFVDDDPERAVTDIGRFKALGTLSDLPALIVAHRVDEVVVALPWQAHRRILEVVRACERENVRVRIVPDLFQLSLSQMVVENLDGIPLIGVTEPHLAAWERIVKRAIDLLGAAVGLLVLLPLMAALALAVRIDSPGPAIFRQERVGRGGRTFTCLKFRTMVRDAEAQLDALRDRNEADGPLFKIKDDPRRTRVGKFLRRTSLDELPQLWNVLRGEMSLTGPRPAIPAEVAQYEPWHLRRLEVSPGISGMWQVSGRSDVGFDEMVLLDIYYIENWSPLLDLRIILKTIPVALFGKGAY
ncbi:MAG: sugar transferase [Chloroflexi bacterium]|nr:sugar transferase [Chloroflexota bacterium]